MAYVWYRAPHAGDGRSAQSVTTGGVCVALGALRRGRSQNQPTHTSGNRLHSTRSMCPHTHECMAISVQRHVRNSAVWFRIDNNQIYYIRIMRTVAIGVRAYIHRIPQPGADKLQFTLFVYDLMSECGRVGFVLLIVPFTDNYNPSSLHGCSIHKCVK